MANVKITHEEFYTLIMENSVLHSVVGDSQYILFGKHILLNDNSALIYDKCEYCGESEIGTYQNCGKCGAPLFGQGVRLTKRAPDVALLSAILEALNGTPRR